MSQSKVQERGRSRVVTSSKSTKRPSSSPKKVEYTRGTTTQEGSIPLAKPVKGKNCKREWVKNPSTAAGRWIEVNGGRWHELYPKYKAQLDSAQRKTTYGTLRDGVCVVPVGDPPHSSGGGGSRGGGGGGSGSGSGSRGGGGGGGGMRSGGGGMGGGSRGGSIPRVSASPSRSSSPIGGGSRGRSPISGGFTGGFSPRSGPSRHGGGGGDVWSPSRGRGLSPGHRGGGFGRSRSRSWSPSHGGSRWGWGGQRRHHHWPRVSIGLGLPYPAYDDYWWGPPCYGDRDCWAEYYELAYDDLYWL